MPFGPTGHKKDSDSQLSLLDMEEWWEQHWQGMPEFVQEGLTPFKTIYVHFENRENLEAFAKLVGQTITLRTRSIWYPEAEIGHFADRRYVDGNNCDVEDTPSSREREESKSAGPLFDVAVDDIRHSGNHR